MPPFAPATSEHPPRVLLIAEIGVNHDGRLDRALELTRAAAEAGADAVKFQWFNPGRLLSNQARLAEYQKAAADDPREMLAKLALSADDFATLRQAAREAGVLFIVTPFSPADVDELAPLGPDLVKIASPDAVNPLLLRGAATLGVPMLISTGTCEPGELAPAARLLAGHEPGGALLQCVSSYPVPDERAAVGGMLALAREFGLPVGYSDHTPSPLTGAVAVAAGAVVLEKHFTHDPAAAGPDHAASVDPAGFADYARLARRAAAMLGPLAKSVDPIEAEVREVARQSLCAARDLPAGHVLTPGDLTVKRPGTGIPAAKLDETLGKRLVRAVTRGDLVQEPDLA
ncbi:MAG: N-acetylneuraminate synthase family protein [Phycisphaeraceae bacterium]